MEARDFRNLTDAYYQVYDNEWKTMMSLRDVERRRNSPSNKIVKFNREEYEYLISHLLDEGYANTLKAAEAIMENMSEDWMSFILEGSLADMFAANNERLKIESQKRRNDAADRIRNLINTADSIVGQNTSSNTSSTGPSMSPLERIQIIKAKLDDAEAKMKKFDNEKH